MSDSKPLRLFCSYSHEDEAYLSVLRTWLSGLEWQGLIEWWHDREITPGWEWEEAIDKNIRMAEIILLLVTPDFMGSRYVYEQEIGKAVERHARGEARVIPVIVRPAAWEETSFGKLQALPKDGKPVTTWPNQDEAWLEVWKGIRKAVEELIDKRQEQAAKERYRNAKERYRKALEQAWTDARVSKEEAEQLDALARELGLSADTAADIERDVMDRTIEETLKRQEREDREKRLEELYAQARELHRNRSWQAVVEVFDQIHSEEPDYPDPRRLLESAREALEIARQEDAQNQYREAVERAWTDEELSRDQVKRLRDLANSRNLPLSTTDSIEREVMGDTKEVILERQKRLEELYDRARRSHQDQEWQAVVDVFAQIHAEDPAYPDSEGLLRLANEALQRARSAAIEEEPDATDAARQKAQELGVDLSQLEGSGAGGRITVKDVVSAAPQKLQRAFLKQADLQEADLRGADLQEADLFGANLKGANLQEADLFGANLNFQKANLLGATLRRANLKGVNLKGADLQRADLQEADLQGATLVGADLQYANLQGAYLQATDLMTQDQLKSTIGSSLTELPQDLNRPEWWSKSIEEQKRLS
jgi:uncharacterized protein YjbI with pentapeptide repeats